MGDRLHLAFGVLGNGASLLLFASPILTFLRVIKKKSTRDLSCIPYSVTLVTCLLWTWYGLPVVSNNWENFPVVTINILGSILELSFVMMYFWFTPTKGKVLVALTTIPLFLLFCITVLVSTFAFHEHHQRKIFVGIIGVVAAVAMYGSPLVVVKQVIKTESVEFMPFYLSFFSFLASSLWMAYGILSHDLLIAAPSFLGCPLSILQLLLYFKYRKRGPIEEPNKDDMEQNLEKTKQLNSETKHCVNGEN